MIAALVLGLFGRAAPAWLRKPVSIAIDVAIAVALVGAACLWIFGRGEAAAGAKITARAERQHSAAVVDARHDERAAQTAAVAIGAAVARDNEQTTAFAQAKTEDIHHALDALPSAPGGAAPARVDGRGLSASLDALIDRANRSADAADAQR